MSCGHDVIPSRRHVALLCTAADAPPSSLAGYTPCHSMRIPCNSYSCAEYSGVGGICVYRLFRPARLGQESQSCSCGSLMCPPGKGDMLHWQYTCFRGLSKLFFYRMDHYTTHMTNSLFYVICDNIRSTYNIGSIFRTSDAAGIDAIYLCGITPRPPRPDIHKVALGAENTVPFFYRKSTLRLVKELKKKNFFITALENNIESTVDLFKFRTRFPLALILGPEVSGIREDILSLCDARVVIPMHGKKESLNVSVAFGVAAYEILRKAGR